MNFTWFTDVHRPRKEISLFDYFIGSFGLVVSSNHVKFIITMLNYII